MQACGLSGRNMVFIYFVNTRLISIESYFGDVHVDRNHPNLDEYFPKISTHNLEPVGFVSLNLDDVSVTALNYWGTSTLACTGFFMISRNVACPALRVRAILNKL